MKKILVLLAGVVFLVAFNSPAITGDVSKKDAKSFKLPGGPFKVPVVTHGGSGIPWFEPTKRGYKIAKEIFPVVGEYHMPEEHADMAWQLSTLQVLLAQKPDAVITSIPDDHMFDEVIKDFEDSGIPVIAWDADDTKGAKGNARSSFIGFDNVKSGKYLVTQIWTKYWKKVMGKDPVAKDMQIVILICNPAAAHLQARKTGIVAQLKEYGVKDDQIKWLETHCGDKAEAKQACQSYLQAHPKTNMTIATQANLGIRMAEEELGWDPKRTLDAAYNLLPSQVQDIKDGYTDLTMMQCQLQYTFMAVQQAYFHLAFGFGLSDVIVTPTVVHQQNLNKFLKAAKDGWL